MPIQVNPQPDGTQPKVQDEKKQPVAADEQVQPDVTPDAGKPVDNTPASPTTGSSISDPNAITVTISDPLTPILILYGPPACGKTMTLIRLARYLKDEGYTVEPDLNFRDSQDPGYQACCDEFNDLVASNDAANSTPGISFMLVTVRNSIGHPICQILEAPGEHYYSPGTKNFSYPPYVQSIINSSNRKVWAVILEPNWQTLQARKGYVDNIKYLKSRLSNRGKILFVYNKSDLSSSQTELDTMNEVSNLYPHIFDLFRNTNPITKIFRPYNCDLVRFQTGAYSDKVAGGSTFTESDDSYPRRLWEKIMKYIRG